jgi:hypothetical protein
VAASSPAETPFVLYVEGPRDRSLLEAWAWRVAPAVARALPEVTVILGGCQPVRAAEHFRGVRARTEAARGLCVLDRDVDPKPMPARAREPGLEFFTWGRRHIESYLLVPEAICRAAQIPSGDRRRARWFEQTLPPAHDESAFAELDAKPLFAHHGALQRLLGRPLRPVQVARAMRHDELHAHVHALLDRLRMALGLGEAASSPEAGAGRILRSV